MLPLPVARTYEEGLPLETGIPRFWDITVSVSCRTREDTVHSSTPLVWVKGTDFSSRVLYKHLQLHRWARGAKVWVEVRHKAHRPELWGPRGVSMPLCQRLSMQINWTCRVRFMPAFFSEASCSLVHLV